MIQGGVFMNYKVHTSVEAIPHIEPYQLEVSIEIYNETLKQIFLSLDDMEDTERPNLAYWTEELLFWSREVVKVISLSEIPGSPLITYHWTTVSLTELLSTPLKQRFEKLDDAKKIQQKVQSQLEEYLTKLEKNAPTLTS